MEVADIIEQPAAGASWEDEGVTVAPIGDPGGAADVESTGRFRIYLGASVGVGKTYAMLSEGRRRKERGTDVVVGFVECHGRSRTEELIEGLEVVPRKMVGYRDIGLEEMDLDAVLRRRASLVLVDESANTNVPGRAGTRSAGRTCRTFWTPAWTSSPRSTSSTWRALPTRCST